MTKLLMALAALNWPLEVERQLVLEATQVMGLSVQSWQIMHGESVLLQWREGLPCVTLPEVQPHLWQCLAVDRIYSWDRSEQPSLWSESRWLKADIGRELSPQVIQIGRVELSHWQERAPLYQIFRNQLRAIAEQEGVILLRQEFVGAFVLHWRGRDHDAAMVAWKEQDGPVLMTQLRM